MAAKFRGPDFSEASRFSILTPDSSNSSGDENDKHTNDESKKKAKNAKKRARKKKKATANSVATAELRQMAFGGSSKQNKIQNSGGVTIPTYVGVHAEEKISVCDNPEWVERDEQFIVYQFQEDLEEAMRLSLEEQNYNRLSLKNENDIAAMKRRKDHSTKLSLAAFQKQPVDSMHSNDIKNLDEFGHVDVNLETKTTPKKVIKKRNNANGVKEEKTKIKCKDEVVKVTNDTQVVNNEHSLDEASLNYWKNQVEEKDKEMELLKKLNQTIMKEISEVKKRNKQLCFILGQGEMRDKSEMLQQVDALTNIRDELSSEISDLHSQLEQERSKVSALRIELAKIQNGRSKKHSNTDNEQR